jgi:diaminopimelate decarboxylase
MWSLTPQHRASFTAFMAQHEGPVFIYDLDGLQAHATHLVQTMAAKLPGRSQLWYACKANPFSPILKVLDHAGFYFDVASMGELTQVLAQGVDPAHILLTGPAKGEVFLRQALSSGVQTFVMESARQIDTLAQLLPEYAPIVPTVLLRVQLQWEGEGSSVLGGSQVTPFGVDLQEAQRILQLSPLPISGIHVFQWGNVLDPAELQDIWQISLETAHAIHPTCSLVDVGGGLGVPYEAHDGSLRWEDAVAALQGAVTKARVPNATKLWMELGRYVVAPYGFFLTRVVDRKTVYGKQMLVLESGVNHLARPMLVGQDFPAVLLRNSNAGHVPFALHGPLCTSLDSLGVHHLPEDIQVGDVLVFGQVGAYGFTESMPFFLGHDLPAEAVLAGGDVSVVRPNVPAVSWMV